MTVRSDHELCKLIVEFIISRNDAQLAVLTEAEIAATLHQDIPSLHRALLADQKITLPWFLTRERLHRALFLMDRRQDLSVQEVAENVGFLELAKFSQAFRDYLLISPHRYKELETYRIKFNLN